VDKTPLFRRVDVPQRSQSPGEQRLRPTAPCDFWSLDDRGVASLVERLLELDSEKLGELANDLRGALTGVSSGEGTPVARRDAERPFAVPARPVAPNPPRTPSQTISAPDPPALLFPRPPLIPTVRVRAAVPPPLSRTRALRSFARSSPGKRSRASIRRVGLLLGIASIALALPWRLPILPDKPSQPGMPGMETQTTSPDPSTMRNSTPVSSAGEVATRGVAQKQMASSATLEPGHPSIARPSHQDVELLMRRGDRFLLARDVAAARLYYERAAAAGSSAAAYALARTYDAKFLSEIGATGVRPDAERAAAWYRAAGRGDGSASNAQLAGDQPGAHE